MKKCLPLCVSDLSVVRSSIEKYREQFDLFELWLDYLEPLELSKVKEFASEESSELLLLFRRKNLEPTKARLEQRRTTDLGATPGY